MEQDHDMGGSRATSTGHDYLENDMNDSKRRKIQEEEKEKKEEEDESRSTSAIKNGDIRTSSPVSGVEANDASLPPAVLPKTIHSTARSTRMAVSVELVAHPSQSQEPNSELKSFELRRQTKRVNYAEERGSDDDDDEEEEEEEEEEDEQEQDIRPTRSRNQSRTIGVQRRPISLYQTGSDKEYDSDKSADVKSEQQPETFGQRTLRDRRSIAAPKPFPASNPPTRGPTSNGRRQNVSRQSRGHYQESSNVYQPSNNSIASKRQPPVARPILENMRITRGMSGSLAPDSANSRDVTPDAQSRQNGRSRSRFHHSVYSDEEQNLEEQAFKDDEAEDEGDEEMEDGAIDDGRASSPAHQDNNGLIRMTRLRARAQTQPGNNLRHRPQRSSRPKTTHTESQHEADRKYDLRERPKNRPTYIADRPMPSPSRPRSSRISSFNGRDPFARPRQGRSSLLEALARTAGSSSDEHETHSFKRRVGTSDSRSSSSRILPMNMHELADSRRDVIASRSSHLADTDPLAVGNSVDFDKVGGLDHHIKSLKEMVILPLLYPEVYSHFQMMPPRGVLFHGPPGTGKTLLARALASSCSTETQKVAFFMRKGADCLSKWVGEAERQLRLLFEEAKAWQPSIIFFDEIDGLCPVRSSKQEQIHASIVSTMLALMDGLDGRGQVIVIGATNRIDAIDPALRRPGRFDREFYFPLPNEAARRSIIDINTCGWVPPLDDGFKDELARMTTRYCGADIKALCTEAALRAIRRRYPQIYESNEKLQIDASTIIVGEVDMLKSAKALTPASYRVTGATASPLPDNLKPLLQSQFDRICKAVDAMFTGTSKRSSKGSDQQDHDASFQAMGYRSFEKLKTFRPRMIVTGERGMGQRYIGPALLHYLEGCTVQQFDLAALMSESSRTPEAACVQYFIEVKRHAPSVIYIPHIDIWWSVVSDAVKATFSNLLEDLDPEDGILFLATSETPLSKLPITIKRWFLSSAKGRLELSTPERESRELFFQPFMGDFTRPPSDFRIQAAKFSEPEALKKAPPPQPRVPTAEEKKLLLEHDQYVLRELRISLRNIVDELYKDRKFKPFFRPVEPEESVDYYQIVKKPMDLTTISEKINDRLYFEVKDFLADIDLIVDNTTLYYDIQDPSRIIHRARAFQDVVYSMVGRLDSDLIIETAKTAGRLRQEIKAQQRTQGERTSRRRLGLEAPAVLDDPELLLRNRAMLNKLAIDSAREGSVDSVAPKMDASHDLTPALPRVQHQDQSQGRDHYQPDTEEIHGMQEGSFQRSIMKQDDDEDSDTSLSLLSSRATSSVNSLTATTTLVEETVVMSGNNTPTAAPSEAMDMDSPRIGDIIIEASPDTTPTPIVDTTLTPAAVTLGHTSVDANSTTDAQSIEVDPLLECQHNITEEYSTVDAEATEDPQEMVLDMKQVALLREDLVRDTEGCSVEELDQLRASLYADIWEHRHDWNKNALLNDVRSTISLVTSLHREYRASEQQAVASFEMSLS
ncbi:ATPase AAA domain-containing protein 2 [Mortierella claussenii]|nr:ATPase AAA domain-containing protein 2 [Mortierella claussenii]